MDIEMREIETKTHTRRTLISKHLFLSKELVKKDL